MSDLPLHYWWWAVALLLLAAETMVPGAFLLWFGVAAGVMGLVMLLYPEMPVAGQAALFALLSFASIFVYLKYFKKSVEARNDQPLLNKRMERMLGRSYTLDTPIEFGRGKIKVGDSLWIVEGPDLPVGARVTVTDCEGATLKVRVAEQ